MRVLTRYLLGRMTAALVLAVVLVAGMIWTLQALRLGHHLLAGGAALLALLSSLLLYSLPTLLSFALPPALALAILFTLAQLGETGELEAMQVAGASPLRLARPAALLCLVTAALALCAEQAEPAALARLQRALGHTGARALLQSLRPGQFHELPDDTVLFAERRVTLAPDRARLSGLLLARGANQLLLARHGTLQVRGARITLALSDGELQLVGDEGNQLTRARFRQMEQTIDLWAILQPHFGFLTRRGDSPRRSWAAAAALGLLALTVALAIRGRLRLVMAGLGAIVLYQLLDVAARQVDGTVGPLVLAAGVCVACLGWLVRASRSGGARV